MGRQKTVNHFIVIILQGRFREQEVWLVAFIFVQRTFVDLLGLFSNFKLFIETEFKKRTNGFLLSINL